jgi:hypothetical protein
MFKKFKFFCLISVLLVSPLQSQSLGETIANFFRGDKGGGKGGAPSALTAYRAYVQTHPTISVFKFVEDVINWATEDSACALRPICYSEVGTFEVKMTVTKGLNLLTSVQYSGWAIQLRVTFVGTSWISGLSAGIQSSLDGNGEVRVARKWKINDKWCEYADPGESAFFFQKNIMVYYLKTVSGGYEFYDADFFTGGIIDP